MIPAGSPSRENVTTATPVGNRPITLRKLRLSGAASDELLVMAGFLFRRPVTLSAHMVRRRDCAEQSRTIPCIRNPSASPWWLNPDWEVARVGCGTEPLGGAIGLNRISDIGNACIFAYGFDGSPAVAEIAGHWATGIPCQQVLPNVVTVDTRPPSRFQNDRQQKIHPAFTSFDSSLFQYPQSDGRRKRSKHLLHQHLPDCSHQHALGTGRRRCCFQQDTRSVSGTR